MVFGLPPFGQVGWVVVVGLVGLPGWVVGSVGGSVSKFSLGVEAEAKSYYWPLILHCYIKHYLLSPRNILLRNIQYNLTTTWLTLTTWRLTLKLNWSPKCYQFYFDHYLKWYHLDIQQTMKTLMLLESQLLTIANYFNLAESQSSRVPEQLNDEVTTRNRGVIWLKLFSDARTHSFCLVVNNIVGSRRWCHLGGWAWCQCNIKVMQAFSWNTNKA